MNPSSEREDLSRLSSFSDGVFAIAITLLVLGIDFPEPHAVPPDSVRRWVLGQGPEVLSYVVSFLVVGNYWVVHHRVFRSVRRYDRGLLWLNLLFLMCVVFIPFPTAVLGDYGGPFAVVLYALTLSLTWLVLAALWWHVAHDRRLVHDGTDPDEVRHATFLFVGLSLVFLASAGIALVDARLATLSWLSLLFFDGALRRVLDAEKPAGT